MLRRSLLTALLLLALNALLRTGALVSVLFFLRVVILMWLGVRSARAAGGPRSAALRAASWSALTASFLVLWAVAQKGFILAGATDLYFSVDPRLSPLLFSPAAEMLSTLALSLLAAVAGICLGAILAALLAIRKAPGNAA